MEMDMSLYLGAFLDEVDEQLQILDEEVLNLEQNSENLETIQRIFRAAHTLKGSSAAMGMQAMKELTHKIENVFDAIRNEQLSDSAAKVAEIAAASEQQTAQSEEVQQAMTNIAAVSEEISAGVEKTALTARRSITKRLVVSKRNSKKCVASCGAFR